MAQTKSNGAEKKTIESISILTGAKAAADAASPQAIDHFIPIRQAELVDLLAGQTDLPKADVEPFRRLSQILSATIHHEYQQELDGLKSDYAPLDPDSDTVTMAASEFATQRSSCVDGLFDRLAKLLERANFTYLSREELEQQALAGAQYVGTESDRRFRRLRSIGNLCSGPGSRAPPGSAAVCTTGYRKVEWDAETYQRLVVLLKLRPHRSLPKGVDHEDVYLKLFKDIPRMDLEMLLPGTQVKMSLCDRTKIVLPTLSGMALTSWKLISGALVVAASGAVTTPWPWLALAGGTISYGLRSFHGYLQTKQRYQLSLTESLYYKNLDNNAGVLMRLLDEAEEQENREALLAYYFLRHDVAPAGLTAEELDQRIEAFLEAQLKQRIDFEVGDALAKLIRWRLVEKLPHDRLRALPLAGALSTLDSAWDQIFSYSQAA